MIIWATLCLWHQSMYFIQKWRLFLVSPPFSNFHMERLFILGWNKRKIKMHFEWETLHGIAYVGLTLWLTFFMLCMFIYQIGCRKNGVVEDWSMHLIYWMIFISVSKLNLSNTYFNPESWLWTLETGWLQIYDYIKEKYMYFWILSFYL